MTVLEAQRVTLAEFEVMSEAHMLRQVDRQLDIHMQAWANADVNQADKNGKAKYKYFKQFFNYEEKLKEITGGVREIENNNNNLSMYKKLSQLNKAGD